MKTPTVLIPVKCRRCGVQSMLPFPVLVVIVGLTEWNHLVLHSRCHSAHWDARPAELRAIRAHLGAVWINAQRTGRTAQLDALPSGPHAPAWRGCRRSASAPTAHL